MVVIECTEKNKPDVATGNTCVLGDRYSLKRTCVRLQSLSGFSIQYGFCDASQTCRFAWIDEGDGESHLAARRNIFPVSDELPESLILAFLRSLEQNQVLSYGDDFDGFKISLGGYPSIELCIDSWPKDADHRTYHISVAGVEVFATEAYVNGFYGVTEVRQAFEAAVLSRN